MSSKVHRYIWLAVGFVGAAGLAFGEKGKALTPEEMVSEAQAALSTMDQAATQVGVLLQTARGQRDVVKVLCLNDSLNQINVAIGVANDRSSLLSSAVDTKDVDRTKHDHTVLMVLRDRVAMLVSDAKKCVGEEASFIGETEVTVIGPSGAGGGDLGVPPEPPVSDGLFLPPEVASEARPLSN